MSRQVIQAFYKTNPTTGHIIENIQRSTTTQKQDDKASSNCSPRQEGIQT